MFEEEESISSVKPRKVAGGRSAEVRRHRNDRRERIGMEKTNMSKKEQKQTASVVREPECKFNGEKDFMRYNMSLTYFCDNTEEKIHSIMHKFVDDIGHILDEDREQSRTSADISGEKEFSVEFGIRVRPADKKEVIPNAEE